MSQVNLLTNLRGKQVAFNMKLYEKIKHDMVALWLKFGLNLTYVLFF